MSRRLDTADKPQYVEGMNRILLTPGEPAGIGPDIILQTVQTVWPAELVVIADPELLTTRAKILGLAITLIPCDLSSPPSISAPRELKYIPAKLSSPCEPGKLNVKNAAYVIETLNLAAKICLNKQAAAIVTGPVNKEIINAAGIPFRGHTEFFAEATQSTRTLMLFVVDKLKVALVTTHLAIKDVSAAITPAYLTETITLLNSEMQKKFGLVNSRILICGLNPHAGEGGYLGREEIETITPVIKTLQASGLNLKGPLAADTIFTPKFLEAADVVLAMYHDQALPLVKYIGFGNAVNVTLGLPFIRTSVDHGTALDVAGTTKAEASSFKAALNLAVSMVSSF